MLSASCQKANLSASLYISITKAFSGLDVIQKIISYAFHGTYSIVAGLFPSYNITGAAPIMIQKQKSLLLDTWVIFRFAVFSSSSTIFSKCSMVITK